ncbi:hypothetical protein E4U41_000727 [Claviceps citrina]|nr:hypothetical protein E4U41_000727 [Claviceps citrina]
MSRSLLRRCLLLTSFAWLARCLDVPLTLYTSTDCKTASSITPSAALNLSTCIVTPGLVSLHYEDVPCAGGGTVLPYLFKDAACAKRKAMLASHKTGSDFRCLSDVGSGTIAAFMLSCNRPLLEQPLATRTVLVGAVATGAAATSTPSASSGAGGRSDDDQNIIEQGWSLLSLGARIGIIAAAAVVALALCVCFCLGLLKCCSRSRPPTDNAPVHSHHDAHHDAYLQVLDNAARAARKHAASGYLDNGHPDPSVIASPRDALPVNVVSAAFAKHDPDWKHKLGAAGELYMFEYLQSLGLPNFGLDNWKSSLRTRVSAYPGYQGIDRARDGIADIEYADESGVLTEFLLALGYSGQGIRQGMRPTYRFEVKTTTSMDWRAPFYVSDTQEAHIRDALITTSQPRQVYIICRVVGLGSGSDTRLNIYLDPEAWRRQGRLLFARDARRGGEALWTVRPV